MRRSERAPDDRPLPAPQQPSGAMDLGCADHLLEVMSGGSSAGGGQHRLPGAGRPDEEDVVGPRRGHLEGALHVVLSLDLAEIHVMVGRSQDLVGQAALGATRPGSVKSSRPEPGWPGRRSRARRRAPPHARCPSDDEALENRRPWPGAPPRARPHWLQAPVQGQLRGEIVL